MNINLFLAYRFIRSKKHSNFFSLTTTFSILGIAVGVTVLILTLQILAGFENSIFTTATNFDSDIKITGYSNRNINYNNEVKSKIEKIIGRDLVSVEPFLSKYTLVKSKSNSDGAIITGLSGKQTIANISKFVRRGKPRLGNHRIIIGQTLAERLGIKINDKITVFALKNDKIPDMKNPPNIENFYVSGIFQVGMPYYDDSFCFISKRDAESLFEIRNEISGLNIYIKDVNKAESYSAELKKALPYPYYSRSIFAIHMNIFVWLELQKKPIPIVLTAIVLVAVFNIVGALFILVLQRKKSIGILRTLGYRGKTITNVFVLQGFVIALLGVSLGALLTLLLTYIQDQYSIVSLPGNIYFIDTLKIAASPFYYVIVTAGTLAVALFASWIPSKFASKISPISAIRNE